MSIRSALYRGLCAVLGIYAVIAVAQLARWTGGNVFASGSLVFFAAAHAALLAMAGLRISRPAPAGSPGALLLTLAMALAIVAGAATPFGPAWMGTARLAVVGLAYIGLRLTAPPAPSVAE